MSGTSSVGVTMFTFPLGQGSPRNSGLYTFPYTQTPGYIQYPDGRRIATTDLYSVELQDLRGQLVKAQQDNQVLQLAWVTAQYALQASSAREETLRAELDKEHKDKSSMKSKMKTLSDNLEDAERRIEFLKLLRRQNPSSVNFKKKSNTEEQLPIHNNKQTTLRL